ncbi:MAG: DprA-like winged helix domain-containing protein, partial [Gammaproteobacteria bacterium]
LEQGREVFAIPGSIQNPLARGCNALIRQGAKLVETTGDILEELGPYLACEPSPENANDYNAELDAGHRILLDHITYDPITVDALVKETGETVEAIASMMLVLELQGYVASNAGGRYTRIK